MDISYFRGMEDYGWRQFVKRIPVYSSPQDIYRAWTTQQGLESWFLRLAEFTDSQQVIRKRAEVVQTGDRYKWLWFGYDDTAAEEGEIISVNGHDQLKFTFSGGCIVTVSVKRENQLVICELDK